MGIFSSKEDRANKIISNFGLDLNSSDFESVQMFADFYEKAITTAPLAITGAKPNEVNQMLSNLVLMQQNMLIIKQLDRINKHLEKLTND